MNNTFGLLFYLKKSKVDSQGKAPIYLCITVESMRSEIITKRYLESNRWSNQANRAIGRTKDISELNAYLDILTAKVYRHYKELIGSNRQVTSETLKNQILRIEEKERTLVALFKSHNANVKKLVGKEFASGKLERYETVLKHIQNFI